MRLLNAITQSIFGRKRGDAERWSGSPKQADVSIDYSGHCSASGAEFYKSRAWQVIRYKALIASDGRCQCCGSSPRTNPKTILHVDHVKPRSRYPALAICGHNLQVLCGECNLGKGAWDQTDWRR